MWSFTFEERLVDWHQLRAALTPAMTPDDLLAVNRWWWRAPMINSSLRWHDIEYWPDPWELLAQNGHCDLARGLGMIYTLAMTYPQNLDRMQLVDSDEGDLVLIDQGEYILNLYPDSIKSTPLDEFTLRNQVLGSKLYKLMD